MARTKAQPQKDANQEAATDEANTTAPDPEAKAPATADPAAGTDAPPPAAPAELDDDEPQPARAVLILRDETVDGVDYRPGDLPALPGEIVDALVARRVADDSPKAIAAARKSRGPADEQERAIE